MWLPSQRPPNEKRSKSGKKVAKHQIQCKWNVEWSWEESHHRGISREVWQLKNDSSWKKNFHHDLFLQIDRAHPWLLHGGCTAERSNCIKKHDVLTWVPHKIICSFHDLVTHCNELRPGDYGPIQISLPTRSCFGYPNWILVWNHWSCRVLIQTGF